MEHRFRRFLQPGCHDGLRDPVRDSGNTQDPHAALRFWYFHRFHRGREITARGHPVPDLVEIAFQIFPEFPERHLIHTRCALIGFHLQIGLHHFLFRNTERLDWQFQLIHPIPPGIPVDRNGYSHG